MKNIREFFAKYYVPNNMAVVMSGDFDPDEAIKKLLTNILANLNAEILSHYYDQKPILSPVVKEVVGLKLKMFDWLGVLAM